MKRHRFAGPADRCQFSAWLAAQPFHATWPLDDVARVATEGLRGDDDLALKFAADALWERYLAEAFGPKDA